MGFRRASILCLPVLALLLALLHSGCADRGSGDAPWTGVWQFVPGSGELVFLERREPLDDWMFEGQTIEFRGDGLVRCEGGSVNPALHSDLTGPFHAPGLEPISNEVYTRRGGLPERPPAVWRLGDQRGELDAYLGEMRAMTLQLREDGTLESRWGAPGGELRKRWRRRE